MTNIDITEHNLDLADLKRILLIQKIKPLRINFWNRCKHGLSDKGYLALDFKIHRYCFTLFTKDYDYEQFYSILEKSRNLNKLCVVLRAEDL